LRKKGNNSVSVLEHNGTSIGDRVRINDLFSEEFIVIQKSLPNYDSLSDTVADNSANFQCNSENKIFEKLEVSSTETESVINNTRDKKGSDPLHVHMNLIKNCKKTFFVSTFNFLHKHLVILFCSLILQMCNSTTSL
jgi:hypothetical protein